MTAKIVPFPNSKRFAVELVGSFYRVRYSVGEEVRVSPPLFAYSLRQALSMLPEGAKYINHSEGT